MNSSLIKEHNYSRIQVQFSCHVWNDFSLHPCLSPYRWTSQLARLKKTHIIVVSLSICHFVPDWNTAPVSALAEYIPCFLPAMLCCHCYHVVVHVFKGLSCYFSHYWLLNLVMVVKALHVPLCLRGQLMACFMSLQSRASLLARRFIHAPFSFTTDEWAGCSLIYLFPSAYLTWATKKKTPCKVPYYTSVARVLWNLWLQIIWSDWAWMACGV